MSDLSLFWFIVGVLVLIVIYVCWVFKHDY